MSGYYNLDGIRTQLNKELTEENGKLQLWEKVGFVTKKDGKPFKILSKNIVNAKYNVESYAMQPGENVLNVHGWINGIGYVSDEMKCYELVRYLQDENKKAKTENYLPKQSYLAQVYSYDLEDIKNAVQLKIERVKKTIAVLENDLLLLDNAFNNYKKAYGDALKQLEIDTNKNSNSSLYYMIKDTIKERYPYC